MKTSHTIYTSFAKRLVMSLMVLMTVGVGSVLGAEELAYTIVFSNSANGNSEIKTTTQASTVIASDSRKYVTTSPFSAISKAYYGDTKTSIRLGTSSATGALTIALSSDGQVSATKIVVSCGYWKSGENPTLSINSLSSQSISSSEQDLTFNVNKDITSLSLNTSKRAYIYSISVYTEASAPTYAVTWKNGGHGTAPTSPTSASEVILHKLSATGYTNTGWTANVAVKNGSNTISAGELINNETTVTLAQATTFTAQWTPTEYTITYNGLEGATHSNPKKYTIESETITFTAPSERVGYNFTGWNPASITKGSTGDKTVTAQWKAKDLTNYRTTCTEPSTCTVTYNANDATSGSVPEDNTEYAKDAQVIVLGNTGNLVKTGYTFSGWNTKDDGAGTTYTAGETFTITENTTLYAQWTAYTINWTINPAGGSLSATSGNSTTVTPDAAYTYGDPAYTVTSGTATVSQNGNTFSAVPTANCTIQINMVEKPKWTVTFDAGEHGTCATASLTETSAGAGVTLPDVTPNSDYRFLGWATTDNATVADAGTTGDTYKPKSNITLYAVYKELHTITWMVGSSSVLSEDVANGTGVTQTPTNNPENNAIGNCANAFMGWTETPLGSTEGQSAPADLCTAAQMKSKHTNVTGDKTFYAVFASAEGGNDYVQISSKNDLVAGSKYLIVGNSSSRYRALPVDKATSLTYVCPSSSKISNPADELIWTLEGTVDKWKIRSTSNNKYLQINQGNLSFVNSTTLTFAVTVSSSKFTFTSSASSGNKILSYYHKGNCFNAYSSANTVYIYKQDVSYSNYVTQCCALACATNLTVSGTTAESATLTWTAPSPTTGITKLQVRDENGNVKVNNLAANATTATITGLKECTSYQYYVVSVGEECEVVSNIVTAQPYGGAKTVNYDYNGGTGSVTSFTTSCTNQTITLPSATRTGYDFNGWYTAATGGTRVGGAGDKYDPATSPITLHAQWTINQYTVTWNPNGGNWGGSTSNIVQTYEYGATIDIPEEPTRENGIFKGWNPEPASPMPADNKTYTAQWDMVYTLTFVDMNEGGTTSTLTQTSSGQNIVAPTANSEVCDMWTFIGWAPSNSLNGGTDKPTGFIAAGETIPGSQITGNKTYYSVYSYNSDNTQEFEVGKSGTYFMYALSSGTKYYATTAKTGGFYGNPETSFATYGPSKFTLTYNKTENKYIIYHENTTSGKESSGYFELNTSDGNVDVKSETPSLFTIQEASNGAFIIRTDYTNSSGTFKERSFGYDGSFTDYSGDNPIYFEPASEIQYYNAANCGVVETYTMSFHNPFDDEDALIWHDAEHEESYYTDKPLNTSIDVFPTMTYNGWAFIGWTANEQYNDWIGDENLDDENSATDDPASSFTIYSNTAGWAYTLNDNVTMYPVFTKFEDNEPFDMVNGGDYYIYYIADEDIAPSKDKYGAVNRIYAGEWESGGTSDSYGATQSCAIATLFTFTKQSNGKWTIYDNTNRKYLCAGATDNNLALNATTATNGEWTITVHNGNQVNAVSKDGYTLSAQSQDATSGTFKNYATSNFNNNSAYYHRIYVGSCTERVYSSNPSNKPAITLSGEPIVTSTAAQSIRAQGELSISATKLAAEGTITLTSDNEDVYFSTVKDANFTQATKPVTPLTLYADEKGKLAMTTVYVHYKPTDKSPLGVQTATITANTGTDGQPNYATATTTATVRNLPADFVIAAKVNDIWYALPNNCNSTSIVNGLPIDVDDPINPTLATFAPAEAKWGLKPVYTTSGQNDRYAEYGEYFVFAETNTGTAGLLYSNKDNAQVQTQGTYSGISGYQEISRYEWIPTTTDLTTYQLTGAQDSKQLNINVNGVFGTHSQLVAENELRLLPIDAIYQHAEVQVVEWRADAVVFMYTGDPTHKVTATLASTSTTKSLSEIKFDHGVYKMPLSNLLSNAGKTMSIKFHDGSTEVARTEITIPVIINGETNTSSLTALAKADYETLDVVILNGGKLTATEGDAAKYRFRNVTVYGGGKLVIGEGKYLSMASIILRAGGFANDGAYDYVYPQFELKGTLSNSAGEFKYDYITDYDHWYHLVLPFDGKIKNPSIKYPIEFYGSNVATTNKGSWQIKRYAGEIRATGNYDAWVDIETEGAESITAGKGYIYWGAPKKVTVNGETTRQKWGIQRIVMTKGADKAKEAENGNKTIAGLSSYANVPNNSGKDNDQGWNLIGNPYMVNLTDMATTGLHACKLVEVIDPATGKWNGKWEWNKETNIRYLTIPSDHFDTYTAKTVAQSVPLIAGRAFFVQLEGEADGITFATANRASLMPALLAENNDKPVDIETGIILSNETLQDEVNFWIKDGKTNNYEYNADYPKTPNNNHFNIYGVHTNGDLSWVATSPEYAAESMPIGYQVPAAGTFTLSVSETYYSENLQALFVTDHEASPEVTTNLVDEDYTFYVNQAETNNTRFTVSIILKPEKENTPTGVDNINTKANQPIKFLYQDKIYILRNGMIYDTTGKQVITINK